MGKVSLKVNYKDLKVLKHALEHYIRRQNISKEDKEYEQKLLNKITDMGYSMVE